MILAIVAVLAFACPAAGAYGPVTFYLTGAIGPDSALQMELTIDQGKVNGIYWYDRIGVPSKLEGQFSGGNLNMAERAPDGKVTGKWTIPEFNPLTSVWKGTWTSGDGKRTLPVQLARVAEMVTTREKNLGHINVVVRRPVFLDASGKPVLRTLQEVLDAAMWAAPREEALRDADSTFFEPDMPSFEFEYHTDFSLCYFSGSLISGLNTVYWYTGGAHGMTEQMGSTFVMSGGKITLLTLDQVFRSGTGWEKKLSDLIVDDLKRQGAADVVNGEIKAIPKEDMRIFTVSPAGISFYFNPYEVSCYADGCFRVSVPWSELNGMVDTKGPAGSLFPRSGK